MPTVTTQPELQELQQECISEDEWARRVQIHKEAFEGGLAKSREAKGGNHTTSLSELKYKSLVLQLYEWTNDEAFLRELAPVALRAADWFANVGTAGTPLPHKQCCTYDIIQFADYDHTSYNSFLYLAALAAGERLGLHLHNASFSAA